MNHVVLVVITSIMLVMCSLANENRESSGSDCRFSLSGAQTSEEYWKMENFICADSLSHVDPNEYLKFLAKNKSSIVSINADTCRFPVNWITRERALTLIQSYGDTTPVPLICTLREQRRSISYEEASLRKSTIGEEALHLVNGYLTGRYPCSYIKFDKEESIRILESDK